MTTRCDCIHVAKAPVSLWSRTTTSSTSESEGLARLDSIRRAVVLYERPCWTPNKKSLSLVETVVGVASDGALIASSMIW